MRDKTLAYQMVHRFSFAEALSSFQQIRPPFHNTHGNRIDVDDVVPSRCMCGPIVDLDLATAVKAFTSVEPCSILIAGDDRAQERLAVKMRVNRMLVSVDMYLA